MKFNIKKVILEQTKYKSGFIPKDDGYVISASMVTKDPLQNYLTILYGTQDQKEITDSTLGSVFHKGIEQIILAEKKNQIDETKPIDGKEHILIEHSMHKLLPNGWWFSGTADIIIRRQNGESEIQDHKLTKAYALKMILKDLNTHEYTVQLQGLDYLNWHENPFPEIEKLHSKLIINVFSKDAKAINKEVTYTEVNVPVVTIKSFEEKIVEISSKLQTYIEEGEIPPRCEDVWERKLKNGVVIPTKCALYCQHGKAGVCPHYKPDTRENVARIVNW